MLACGFATALGLVLAPPAAVAAPQPVPDSAPDEASASRAARAGDKQVRVDGLTDETTEVLADPDGTFTMTQHVRPVRVKQDGAWTPVDTTLVERPDGTVAPRAAAVDVAISGGGRGPLATVEIDGSEVGLVWPEALPRPVLEGPTATYREVMPGVDLKVTADVEGFSQVLVVKHRSAAEALDSVAFGTHTRNAKVEAHKGNGAGRDSDLPTDRQDPSDALKVKNPAGETVFIGDASRMWDSAGEATPQERLDGAGTGANTAAMDATVTPKGVTVEPDAEFLADPDTVYPVYLDPSYTCTSPNCGKAHHAVVQSQYPDAQNYNRTDGKLGDLKAGYACDGPCFVSRTYLGMKTASLDKKIIHSADLHLEVIHSAECANATPTELWRSNSITSTFTWNTQQNWGPGSGWGAKLSTGNVKNNATYCPGASGMDLDATAAVVDAAAGGWDVTTFMLKGSSESNQTSWRRFGLNPFLVVKYNSKPNAPTDLGINGWGSAANQALPCTTGTARSFVNTRTPRLRARVSDPDGGTLSAGFRVFVGPHNNYTGPVVDTVDSSTASGLFAEITVPSGRITADGVHTWHLWSSDGDVSSWSPNCEVHVDTVAPATPVVTSEKYPTGRPAGGVGVASTFTFAPPTVDPQKDIDYYLYGFTEQGGVAATKANPATLNAPATISWTPQKSGPQVLSVKAVDRAGNVSGLVDYRFEVADYQVDVSGNVGRWSFEDNLADTSAAKSLTYVGPPPPGGYFDAGHTGLAVHMDSANSEHYQSKHPLVRTNRSFTVSAWAMLGANGQHHTVLSQEGVYASGAKLQYDATLDRWTISLTQRDAADPGTITAAKSAAPPALYEWTHLTGVYDGIAGQLRLYVNGVLDEQVSLPFVPWTADGPLFVGASRAGAGLSNHYTGAIDTVRVHDRALTGTEIADLHAGTGSAIPATEYLFEGALDNTGANNDLTASGTAAYSRGYAAKAFDPAYWQRTQTAAPVLTTTKSYSTTAWVKLENKDDYRAVVSQDGQRASGFVLRYSKVPDRWSFGVGDVDADSVQYTWATGTSVPQVGVWTHLAAVYDAPAGKIRLYVNGAKEAEVSATAVFAATGRLRVGSSQYAAADSSFFVGDIDEVNAYNGALTDNGAANVMNTPVERARYRLDETAGTTAADAAGGPPAQVYGPGHSWALAGGQQSAQFNGVYVQHNGTVAGSGPIAAWEFEQSTADYTGNGHDLVHRNATGVTTPTYAAGRSGNAVVLDGLAQRLQRNGPVVDTTASFSISARVKLTRDNAWFTVASQDGTRVTPFIIQYSPDDKRWAFTLTDGDRDNPGQQTVLSKHRPVLNAWADLLAVYDATANTMRLYVGGVLQGEKSFHHAWKSTGSFVLGRVLWNGAQVNYFPGSYDEVRVYNRALTPTDAHTLWDLGSSISAPPNAEFRSEQSFAVSAWVRNDGPREGVARAALSLDPDGNHSPLILGYRHEWDRFGVLVTVEAADGTTRGWWVLSDQTSALDVNAQGWAHLTVVYDAPRKLVKLYVNGTRQTTVPTDATTVVKTSGAGSAITMPATGRNLVVGRAVWQGAATDYWKGAVRDVRMFSGALPEACDSAPWCTSQLPVL